MPALGRWRSATNKLIRPNLPNNHWYSKLTNSRPSAATLKLLLCAVLCSSLAYGCSYTKIGPQNDWAAYESRFPRAATAKSHVVVVDIDDASLADLGEWPPDRAVYAKAIEQAFGAGASVVALDLILETERSQEGDDLLADLAQKNKRIAFAYQSMPETPRPRLFRKLALAAPTMGFVDAGCGSGCNVVTMIPDIVGEQSLAMVVAAKYCEHATPVCSPRITSSSTDMVYGKRATRLWGINFAAPAAMFPRVPFHKLLRGNSGSLQGKIVIFSPSAPRLEDRHWIPDGKKRSWQPGSVALAFAIETAIAGTSLFVLPPWAFVLILAGCNVLVLVARRSIQGYRNALMASYLLLLIFAHWALFNRINLHLPITILAVNVICLWIVASAFLPAEKDVRKNSKSPLLDSDFLLARNRADSSSPYGRD